MAWLKTKHLKNFADGFAEKVTELFAKKEDIPGVMQGATEEGEGKSGLTPKPNSADINKYLRGDGTWNMPPDTNTTYSNMQGATASAAGIAGLVPAPQKGQNNCFLRGDGTWAEMEEATDAEIDQILEGTFN